MATTNLPQKPKQKQNKKPLVIIGVSLLGLLLVAGGLLAWNLPKNPRGQVMGCKTTDGIRVCLETFKTSGITSSEDITVKVRVTNTTPDPYEVTFSCTDTSAGVTVNDELDLRACGQALTDYTLESGATRIDTSTIAGSSLREGRNKLVGGWAGKKSEAVYITRISTSQKDLESQFKTCQNLPDNIAYGDIPSYCESVSVVLFSPRKMDNYSCEFWKDLIAGAGLNIPCDKMMDTGIGSIYLPKEYVGQYKDKLKALDYVSQVGADQD
ncbi:MAG: hypothetical protein WBP26_00530 [Candidatus Saccharimonadales bacterium]